MEATTFSKKGKHLNSLFQLKKFGPSITFLITFLALSFVLSSNFLTLRTYLQLTKSTYIIPNIQSKAKQAATFFEDEWDDIKNGHFSKVKKNLLLLLKDPAIEKTTLIDNKGFLIYDSSKNKKYGTSTKSRETFIAKKTSEPIVESHQVGNNRYYSYIVPIKKSQERLGTLIISYSNLSLKKVFSNLRSRLIINNVIVAIFVIICVFSLIAWLTKPLAEIIKIFSEIITSKNLKLRIRERGIGHIKSLTKLFNRLLDGMEDMVELQSHQQKTIDTFQKYLPPKVVKMALKGELELGGEETPITLLYVDIKKFTHLTDYFGAQEIVKMLSEFRKIVDSAIFEYEGTLDKHIGDAVLAFWGAPLHQEDKEIRALKCLSKIIQKLAHWNKQRSRESLPQIQIWAVISSGPAIVGNIGFEDRMEYTAIGPVVNKMVRIVEKAHILQKPYLIDYPTRIKMNGMFKLKDLGEHELRGVSEKTRIYEFAGKK